MKVGHKYLVQSLVVECGKKVARGISKENVLELGVLADTLSYTAVFEGNKDLHNIQCILLNFGTGHEWFC